MSCAKVQRVRVDTLRFNQKPMGYAVYHQLSLRPALSLREHFPKPHRDTRAEPFDARCCHGYWIKVSRFAEEIISQAARGQGCRLSHPLPPLRSIVLFAGSSASSTPGKKLLQVSGKTLLRIFSTCRVSLQTKRSATPPGT